MLDSFLAVVFVIGIYASGSILNRFLAFPVRDPLEEYVISTVLGFLSLEYFLFGIWSFFHPGTLTAIVIYIGLTVAVVVKQDRIRLLLTSLNLEIQQIRKTTLRRVSLLIVVAVCLVLFIEATIPEHVWDSLVLHLAVPNILANGVRINELPITFAYWPIGPQLVYTLQVLISGQTLARHTGLCFALLFILGSYLLGKRYGGIRVGGIASLILVSSPLFVRYGNTLYADIPLAFFVTVALLAVKNGLTPSGFRHAVLLGLLLSAIWITKPQGFIYSGLTLLFLAVHLWKEHVTPVLSARFLLALAATVVILISPWYLRAYYWSGGQFVTSLGQYSGETVNSEFFAEQTLRRILVSTTSEISTWSELSGRPGHGWYRSFLLPFDITFHGEWWGWEWVGPTFLMLLPLVFIKDRIGDFWKDVALLVFVGAGVITWVVLLKQLNVRYLFPMMPMMSIVLAMSLTRFSESYPHVVSKIMSLILAVIVVNTFGTRILEITTSKLKDKPSQTLSAIGLRKADEPLRSWDNGSFGLVLDYVNDSLSAGAVVFTNDLRIAYFRRRIITTTFNKQLVTGDSLTIDTILDGLRKYGVTHILLNSVISPPSFVNARNYRIQFNPNALKALSITKTFGNVATLYSLK